MTRDVREIEPRCRRRFLVGDGGGDDRRAKKKKTDKAAEEVERSRLNKYCLLIARRYNDKNYLEWM